MGNERFILVYENRVQSSDGILGNKRPKRFSDIKELRKEARDIRISDKLDIPLYYYDRLENTFNNLIPTQDRVSEKDQEEFKLTFPELFGQ